jgi:UDP-N-acetylmuramate dehydrogenase
MLPDCIPKCLEFLLQEQVPLAPYTTFGIGGPARWFASVETVQQLAAACAWAREQQHPVFVLGGGSNVLVADAGFAGLVIRIGLRGVVEDAGEKKRIFRAAAGEDWDDLVSRSVAAGCAGIECLAGIPGTVGGSPVQNIGAYGQEVAQTIVAVHCFDRETAASVTFSSADCGFSYRTSRFNTLPDQGRYIVTEVAFALRPTDAPHLEYADLKRYFAARAEPSPSLAATAEAVRAIRRTKGMVIEGNTLADRDPDTRSAGSFFKNPTVSIETYEAIAAAAAPVPAPSYPAPENRRKLPAAWLMEQAGFHKGFTLGNAALSSRHPLALTNRTGHASAAEILALRDHVIAEVQQRFNILLEPEPIFVGSQSILGTAELP